ncbi:MAG: NAD-dependent malic enzyme [Actinomycetota bacterium]
MTADQDERRRPRALGSRDRIPHGRELLLDRFLNKGTAFPEDERDRYGLRGLLHPAYETLPTQIVRTRTAYDAKHTDLERHIYLRELQGRNSVLFYRFLAEYLEELLPIIYTPTVGLACQEFSRTYRREHGLTITWADRNRVPQLLENAIGDAEIDVIVVTDGERVLGLGDLGAGGMGIPIGKLALYTVAGGIDPSRTLPVLLDTGTDNEVLLSDLLYLGWRHNRIRDDDYDRLVDAFVDAVADRWPNVLLQWEDFAQRNARRLLDRHRERVCSFNDDIQGTAAVTYAAIRSGMLATGTPLEELRMVIVGAGSAGTGIADQVVCSLTGRGVPEDEAVRQVWLVDREGLVHEDQEIPLEAARRYARPVAELEDLGRDADGDVTLGEVVSSVRPHVLVGVSGQPGLFTEEVIRDMAAGVEIPIVLPLSNPTPRIEALPSDVIAWTDGRCLVGTGSPFDAVAHGASTHHIAQVNNVHIFPGIGLGVRAVGARRISDGMITAAADAVADMSPAAGGRGKGLLPPVKESREVADAVAKAVGRQAVAEGLADELSADEIDARISAVAWEPIYLPLP